MKLPTLVEMLDAGVHFGHKKQRSYPRARKYTYCLRDGIYVINLDLTLEKMQEALDFLSKSANEGKTILLVGTKNQAKSVIVETAKKTEMPYVSNRWLGGTLTNFETIRKSIKYLEELEKLVGSDEFKAFTKNERMKTEKEIKKLHHTFDGILTLSKLPDVLFALDAKEEDIAIAEAIKKNIPVVAVCDTDADPDKVDYPIPANDDALKSIEMIVNLIGEAIIEGKAKNKS